MEGWKQKHSLKLTEGGESLCHTEINQSYCTAEQCQSFQHSHVNQLPAAQGFYS